MPSTYYTSPFGTVEHPWINKPDTKYNDDGVFKCPLWVEGPEAIALAETVTEASDQALAEYVQKQMDQKKMTAGEAKKWSAYYPFEHEEDESGNRTGRILFDFKQNATIRLRDGTTKKITVGIYDADDKAMTAPIFSGTKLRVRYSLRPIPIVSAKEVGVRLDFASVQVIELVAASGRGSGRGGFGSVEGGYVTGDTEADSDGDPASDY